jgi:hypothetical protein
VRQVELAGTSSVFSPSLEVITVAIELHDARIAGGIELEHKIAANLSTRWLPSSVVQRFSWAEASPGIIPLGI